MDVRGEVVVFLRVNSVCFVSKIECSSQKRQCNVLVRECSGLFFVD